MIHHITCFTRKCLFWFLIIFAVAISSVRLFFLGIDEYRAGLENKIRELTSIPIEIGSLRANFRGINPEIVLKNIKIDSAEQQNEHAIQLKEARVGLDLGKLLFTRQVLPSSWLTLVGVKLSIIRSKDGKLSVIGLSSGDSEQPVWLLSGGQYEVLKSDITWIDELRDAPPITFKNVDLSIKNNRQEQVHELHLVSHLPEQYGETMRVFVDIKGNILDTENISGDVYVEANNVYFSNPLKELLPVDITITDSDEKGSSSFKLWSHWQHSNLVGLSGNVQANNAILHKQHQTLNIKSLSTEFIGTVEQSRWQLSVNHFDLETQKYNWPTAQFSLDSNKELTQLSSVITQIDLHQVSELLGFFAPMEKEKQALISNLAVKGVLKDFIFDLDLANSKYAGRGSFEGFFVNAHSGIPQMENLTGSLRGNNSQGEISLNTKRGALFFPNLMRQPFSIENLYGQVAWQQKPDKWQIQSESLVFDTKDIQTETRMLLTIPKSEQSVFMDLQTSFSNMQDISSVSTYYPVSIMGKNTVNWLDNAFVSGRIEQGGVLVYGELNQFPFLQGQGVFEVLFNVADVELKFAPGWPNLTDVAAEVLFLKNSLAVDIGHASVHGLKVKKTLVEIPSFEKSDRLMVKGEIQGSIGNALNFLQQTPVNKGVDDFVQAVAVNGNTKVTLGLKIPLTESATEEVDGIAEFNGAALTVKPVDLDVKNVHGELKFTEKGLSSNNLRATALGYPIAINVAYDDVKTMINIAGKTDGLQLKKQFAFLDVDILKDSPVEEGTPYQIILDLPNDENLSPELILKSNLAGMQIDLPGKLNKLVAQEKPLLMNMVLNKQGFLPLKINYGDDLKAALTINTEQNQINSAQIVYGEGDAVVSEEKGINIQIEQDVFEASEWVAFVKQSSDTGLDSELKLNRISLATNQLEWKGKDHGSLSLNIQCLEDQWQGSLLSSIAKGRFTIPFDLAGPDNIKLDLDALNLSGLMKLDTQTEGVADPNMPGIDILSKQLWWNNVNLGSLEIETEKVLDGLRFNRIDVISENLIIKLKADWFKAANYSVTELYGDVSSKNLGEILSQLDITNDLKETHANVGIIAKWHGLPYLVSLEKIEADLDLSLKNGRISSIEPGFGRLIGLIAMDQWVKRLSFDFGDVYKEGLSFNSVTGDFKLKKGKIKTRNLLVDAVPARISINGEVDLIAKTLDHNVKVVPKSSGAIPIAGTIVGGIAGAITQAIDKDYKEGYFFGSSYNVIGQWDDIKVIPLPDQDGLLKKTWSGLTGVSEDDADR